MAQFYDSLKALISPAMISRASSLLNENENNISKATTSIIASFLGVLLKKGNTPQIRESLEESGNLNILAQLKDLWGNDLTQDQQRLGDNFTQQLLGDKAADFSDAIASSSGITKVATNKLVSMVAPIITGFLGNKMTKEDFSLHGIINEISKEKNLFSGFIPSSLISSFGLSDVLNKNTDTIVQDEKKKGGMGWLLWVLLLVALLLLFLWWRSCQESKTETITTTEQVTISSDTVSQSNRNTATDNQREKYELTLPDGVKLQVYKGGVEDQMVKFLNSDEYKNATDDQLKEKWFEFDDLAFEFGSSTNLKDNSEKQLDNIAAILKSYKDAKIKLGGFADKVGTEKANQEISEQRAKNIENMLDKKGVGSQVVKIQGFGEEYAKHSAKESNDQRAEDRDIALRFVKK